MSERSESEIREPFDPSSIDVEKKNMSVSSLIAMLENDMIDLEPAFQRKKDLWPDDTQSRLIESLLLKLPLPSMYFEYDAKRKKYTVIDGLQRLCAIKHFAVDKDLRLCGLEFIHDAYEGKGYDDLVFQDKLAIGLEEIAVNILKNSTPDFAKFIIFKRLNSGGTKLTNQEIRNALFQGVGLDLITRLAESDEFREVGVKADRMKDREFILRFFAFYLNGYDRFSGRMETFLTNTLRELNKLDSRRLAELSATFMSALERNMGIFGRTVFRLAENKSPSASLFDVLMVTMADLDEEESGGLLLQKDAFVSGLAVSLSEDARLRESVGSKSDRKFAVDYRYNSLMNLVNKYIR